MDFFYFSLTQGVLAFMAPCAVALLPGYIVAFISRNSQDEVNIYSRLGRGFKLAFFSILGILLVYSVAGLLIIIANQLLKEYMKWIAMAMGGVLIVVGVLMVMGKSFSFTLHIQTTSYQVESMEAFVFGIAYAIGALGCLFPLFLVVATQSLAADTVWQGTSYIMAYFLGLSGMMIATILLSTFAKQVLMKYLRKILPHMERITGILLIVAGIYIIHYQTALI